MYRHKIFRSIFSGIKRTRNIAGFWVVALIILVGISINGAGRAAVPYVSVHADQGTVSGSAIVQNDSTASDGKRVQFGGTTSGSGFVTTCGTLLCLNGSTWYMYGASVLGGLDNPAQSIQEAKTAKLNTLRIVDFLNTSGPIGSEHDTTRWQKVDNFIATAKQNNFKVLLDLSTYRNLLKKNQINPYTYDWQPFLKFVTSRVNTANGQVYGNDSTIALVSLAGEVDPPGSVSYVGFTVTTQNITDFYTRTLAQWKTLTPNILINTGGLLHLNGNSGIDWQTIFALTSDEVCSIHNYSAGDSNVTTPNIATYCQAHGKPWVTEEFGFSQTLGDSTRATDFQTMYDLQQQHNAAGVAFWNLGLEVVGVNGKTDTYDVNANTPLTLQTVIKNAPN